jgi:hypothetical protein
LRTSINNMEVEEGEEMMSEIVETAGEDEGIFNVVV